MRDINSNADEKPIDRMDFVFANDSRNVVSTIQFTGNLSPSAHSVLRVANRPFSLLSLQN